MFYLRMVNDLRLNSCLFLRKKGIQALEIGRKSAYHSCVVFWSVFCGNLLRTVVLAIKRFVNSFINSHASVLDPRSFIFVWMTQKMVTFLRTRLNICLRWWMGWFAATKFGVRSFHLLVICLLSQFHGSDVYFRVYLRLKSRVSRIFYF